MVTLIVPHSITGGVYILVSIPASATRPTLLVRALPIGPTTAAFCLLSPARGRVSWAGATRTAPLLHLAVSGLPAATALSLYVDAGGSSTQPYEVAHVQSDRHGGVVATIRARRAIGSAVQLLFESRTGRVVAVRAVARSC
ncbi:MAG: hypothetical protein NVSMB65_22380 [Chloroflexota bacterium]